MVSHRPVVLLIAGVLGGVLPLSSEAVAQTLEAALSQAYTANPTLNAQRAATRAFDENVPQALAGYRPTVNATAQYTYDTTSVRAPGGISSNNDLFPYGYGLQATQTLFNGFRTANSVRSAEAGVLGQQETLRNTEQTVLLDGVTSYMNVLRDAALLNLQNNNVQVLQEQLRQTQDRFNVGEVTRTDVEQARASLAGGQSQQLAAQAQLKSSTAIYRQIIGSEPRRLSPARPIEKLLPRDVGRAVQIALSSHPSITAALHAVDQAELQVKVAEGALYPTVTAQGTVTQSFETTNGLNRVTDATIGAYLSVPIYQGGAEYSRVRQAKETVGQTRIQADLAREQVRAAVVTAWGNLAASTAQIQANNASVAASEVALSGVREEAKVGQRTTLDVLNAQQTLLNGRVALVTAQRDRVVASYTLLSSIGGLNASRLGLRVADYQPETHYRQVRDKWFGLRTPDGR